MKFCPECGSPVANSKFCPECGHRLVLPENGAASAALTENREAELLAPFETIRHQNGKYAILMLKNKSELVVEVPACVESIMDGAFEGSCVMIVTLPEGLVQIRDRAFAQCTELVKINFPTTLVAIGNRAFAGCSRLDIAPPQNVRLGWSAFEGTPYTIRAEREARERKQAEEERRRREAEEARRREQEERERDPEYCLKTARSYEEAAPNSYDREKCYRDAFSFYSKAAALGNAEGQYQLGRYYGSGIGTERNTDESMRWYRKAAEQGHAFALRAIGSVYFHGYGVTEDKAEGIRWWKKAAEAGDVWIANELGKRYYNGLDVTKDYAQAVVWCKIAAEHGYAESRFMLAECYHFGRGVAVDHTEALKHYSTADTPEAIFMAGEHYYHGWGVPRDLKLAKEWYEYGGPGRGIHWCDGEPFRDAYRERTAMADARLGDVYFAERDYIVAKGCYERALARGVADIVKSRLGECYYHLAEQYFNRGKINDADTACQSALKYGYSVPYSFREKIEEKKKAQSASWYRKCWGGS